MNQKHKNDLILCAVLVGIGIASLLVLYAIFGGTGEAVVVTVDGEEAYRLALDEDAEILIEGYDGGKNLLVIKDGEARITEADCPEQVCVHTGKADELKSIVCAHNRVVVSIEK